MNSLIKSFETNYEITDNFQLFLGVTNASASQDGGPMIKILDVKSTFQ